MGKLEDAIKRVIPHGETPEETERIIRKLSEEHWPEIFGADPYSSLNSWLLYALPEKEIQQGIKLRQNIFKSKGREKEKAFCKYMDWALAFLKTAIFSDNIAPLIFKETVNLLLNERIPLKERKELKKEFTRVFTKILPVLKGKKKKFTDTQVQKEYGEAKRLVEENWNDRNRLKTQIKTSYPKASWGVIKGMYQAKAKKQIIYYLVRKRLDPSEGSSLAVIKKRVFEVRKKERLRLQVEKYRKLREKLIQDLPPAFPKDFYL